MLSLIVKSLVSPQKYFHVKIPTWLARQQATGHRFRTKPQHCGEDLVKQENSNLKQKMLYYRKNSLLRTNVL